jgi:hypothetical protein
VDVDEEFQTERLVMQDGETWEDKKVGMIAIKARTV